VHDFARYSRYRRDIQVMGLVPDEPFPDIPYVCVELNRRWFERRQRAYLQAILKQAEETKPELIEVHNRPALALQLAGCTKVPVALHLHNDPQEMRKCQTAKQRTLLLRKMYVYCVSRWVRERLLDGVPESLSSKVFVTPCGIELPEKQAPKGQEILYVGRMTPNKGVLEAVQAMAEVLPEFPGWNGRVIGGRRHSISEELSDYEKQIQEAATPAIFIDGFQPYEVTQAAVARAALMVVPSKWDEPFGRTALEGMAHGCAVITSGHGGLREVVEHHALISAVAPDALASAMRMLMEDDALRNMLQRGAPQQAERYRIDICATMLDNARATITGRP
jgi:glycosyltransferase involved in cell wall biosynthesis